MSRQYNEFDTTVVHAGELQRVPAEQFTLHVCYITCFFASHKKNTLIHIHNFSPKGKRTRWHTFNSLTLCFTRYLKATLLIFHMFQVQIKDVCRNMATKTWQQRRKLVTVIINENCFSVLILMRTVCSRWQCHFSIKKRTSTASLRTSFVIWCWRWALRLWGVDTQRRHISNAAFPAAQV